MEYTENQRLKYSNESLTVKNMRIHEFMLILSRKINVGGDGSSYWNVMPHVDQVWKDTKAEKTILKYQVKGF